MTHPYEPLFAAYQRRARGALRQWPEWIRDEALSYAWLQAVRYGIGTEGNLFGWLVRVAQHEACRLMEREFKVQERDVYTSERADGDPAERVVALSECAERRIMVRALKPKQRAALVLQAAGYSMRETSALVGTGTFTWANRHLTEGRRALREMAEAGA